MTTTLRISKADFSNRLNSITDQRGTGMFSDMFDSFSSSKNEFKGQIGYDNFKLKRRRRFFDSGANMAVANGTFLEINGELTIETEISGFHDFYIAIYIIVIIIYALFIFGISTNIETGIFVLPFILLHATFMFVIPYFVTRRSVKRLKYELKREFFYLTKKE